MKNGPQGLAHVRQSSELHTFAIWQPERPGIWSGVTGVIIEALRAKNMHALTCTTGMLLFNALGCIVHVLYTATMTCGVGGARLTHFHSACNKPACPLRIVHAIVA